MDDKLSDKAKLYTKILNVQNKVEAITKDKTNTHLKYGYASEKAIIEGVKKILVEEKLLVMIECDNQIKDGPITLASYVFEIADTETGESIFKKFQSQGKANDDKGIFISHTQAVKYFLSKTFLIPTDDDAEKTPSQPVKPQQAKAAPVQQAATPQASQPAQSAPVSNSKTCKQCQNVNNNTNIIEGKYGAYWKCTECGKNNNVN